MYGNHPLREKLREICYVDKWLSQTLPFPDIKCFCTSVFYCSSQQVLFLSLHSQLLEGEPPPQPPAQVQSWTAGRVHLRYSKVRKAQRKNWKLNEHKILDVAVTISFFPDQATYRSVLCRKGHRHHWLLWWCTPGPPRMPWPPSLQGHILVPMMRVWLVWGVFLATLSLPSGTRSLMVHRLSCLEACVILVPQPVIKSTSPALEDRFLTTGPSGKSLGLLESDKYISQSRPCYSLIQGRQHVLLGLHFFIREMG